MTAPVAQDRLRSLIERVERVEADIRELNADKSEIYKEARGEGFDVKTMRKVVAARKIEPADREEADALFDAYMAALGELPGDEPSRVHVHEADAGSSNGRTPDFDSGDEGSSPSPATNSEMPVGAFTDSAVGAGTSDGCAQAGNDVREKEGVHGPDATAARHSQTPAHPPAGASAGAGASPPPEVSVPAPNHDDFDPERDMPEFLRRTAESEAG